MSGISERKIIEKHPWVYPKRLFNEDRLIEKTHMNWHLDSCQLELADMLFDEIENWFKANNKPLDVKIFGVSWLFDSINIDCSSNHREVFLLIDKYKGFSKDLYLKEESDDEDIF